MSRSGKFFPRGGVGSAYGQAAEKRQYAAVSTMIYHGTHPAGRRGCIPMGTEVGEAICLWAHLNTGLMQKGE